MPKNSYSKIHSNANCKSLSIFLSQRMCYILLPKLLLLFFFREKEGCQEMLLWVQIRNLLFFVGKSSFHKRHTSKDCHFDSGHVWQKCLKFDILKILHQKCIDFKEEAILKNSYNSSTLFPLGRDTFYHCASRNRVKTMIQTMYTLNCSQKPKLYRYPKYSKLLLQ